jgi:hypothetical protein
MNHQAVASPVAVTSSAISSDPRFAELERLIEAADRTTIAAAELVSTDPAMPKADAAADEADSALEAFIAEVVAVRPQTLTEFALQARAAHYWHERLHELIEVTDSARMLVQSVLDAAGIVPKSYDNRPTANEVAEAIADSKTRAAELAARRAAIEAIQDDLDEALELRGMLNAALAADPTETALNVRDGANSQWLELPIPADLRGELISRELAKVESRVRSKQADLAAYALKLAA